MAIAPWAVAVELPVAWTPLADAVHLTPSMVAFIGDAPPPGLPRFAGPPSPLPHPAANRETAAQAAVSVSFICHLRVRSFSMHSRQWGKHRKIGLRLSDVRVDAIGRLVRSRTSILAERGRRKCTARQEGATARVPDMLSEISLASIGILMRARERRRLPIGRLHAPPGRRLNRGVGSARIVPSAAVQFGIPPVAADRLAIAFALQEVAVAVHAAGPARRRRPQAARAGVIPVRVDPQVLPAARRTRRPAESGSRRIRRTGWRD